MTTSKSHTLFACHCHRHPTLPFTGFCPSCLRERLAGFHSPHSPPSLEPHRHSCEVLPRSSLSDVFGHDHERSSGNGKSENSGFGIEEGNEGMVRVCDDVDEEMKTMKEFIDLELQSRRNELRSFRDALSEKFRKWKHRLKKKNVTSNENGRNTEKMKKAKLLLLKETQSEVGEYGLGRRSCDDTDPRFSISMDWPRASWDECFLGPCSCSKLEDSNDSVLVEEEEEEEESDNVSFDIFDGPNSHKRHSMSEVVDELKSISNSNSNANAKVSPASTELFHGANLLVDEKDLSLRDANVKSLSYVQSDSVIGSVSNGVRRKGFKKLHLHKWGVVWNKLGLVQRRKEEEEEEEKECVMIDKPAKRVVNVGASESVSEKLSRSCSVSSSRNPIGMPGLVNNIRTPHETKGNNVLNGKHEFMLQRNRSVRYSPNNYLDNGLLRFYLTPLRSYRRSKSVKSSIKDLHPITRSVF